MFHLIYWLYIFKFFIYFVLQLFTYYNCVLILQLPFIFIDYILQSSIKCVCKAITTKFEACQISYLFNFDKIYRIICV